MKKLLTFPVFLFFLSLSFFTCFFSSCIKEVKKKPAEAKPIYKVTLVRDGKPVDSKVVR